MNQRMMRFRNKNPTHTQMLEKGFSLKRPEYKQPRNHIMHIQTGNNGRQYYRDDKMTKREINFDKAYDRRKKSGKEVYISCESSKIFMDLLKMKIDVTAKKDTYGNIIVSVSKWMDKK